MMAEVIEEIMKMIEEEGKQQSQKKPTRRVRLREKEEGQTMNVRELTNQELFDKYKGKRGEIVSEMCRRAGTIKYLIQYCTQDDREFTLCMRDTIDVFKSFLLSDERKNAKY